MNYLARQAGGLTDVQFEKNDRQSLRDRNWFKVNWNMLALIYDIDFHNGGAFNVRAFGMLSDRQSLGFLGKISQADPGGNREMIAGDFKNAGAEARFLQRYKFNLKNKPLKGAFLVGGRYYQGYTTSLQGTAPDGDDANFKFLNRNDLENSNFSFPSQNVAFFAENITYLTPKLTFNIGVRYEYIQSASEGFYKRYVIHPVNFDTLAIYKMEDSKKVKRSVPLFGGGLSYKYGQQNSVYFNFTQNYRAINFTDIRVNNPNIVIDSNIRDEYGYTMELGTRGMVKDFFIYDLAGFYVFYGDKIGLAPKTGTIYKERTNIGDAINLGIEVFSEFDFLAAFVDSSKHHLSLFVNFAYIYTNYIKSKESSYVGNQVEYVSPIILRSGIKWSNKKWSVQIQGAYNAAQFADATNSVEPSGDAVIGQIPSYMVFDVSGRYTLNKYFTFEAGINNFTNSKYYTRRATAYPGPGILPSDGINCYGTVQFKFGLKK
jgi:Fe(3+) dicitrate transport protein